MTVRPIYAASLLIASLGALAFTNSYYYIGPVAIVDEDEEMMPADPVDEAPTPPMIEAPATEQVTPHDTTATNPPYAEPPITVTISPEDRDTLINKDVVDALSSDSRLSGKIGVETYRQVVTLTGRVTDSVQVDRAGRIARGVTDVNDVQNLIRARVGG